MAKLIITRGLPGSGKSTWARQQPGWRVNRDDLRNMLLPDWPHGDELHERVVTLIQHHAVQTLLNHGFDVIVDDTNLDDVYLAAFHGMASHVVVKDFCDVPLETCIERDAARPTPVGADVIRGMHARYLAPKEAAFVEVLQAPEVEQP